ncbi:XK-related protein 8-like [Porites lutea]|uniref:XK-related protein 8-like n=1 Tax=Porites lutea TaxID=51062 RepID=UPI003CC65273
MVAVAVHLKWHQTFLFLFQTVLFVADTTTDVLTSVEYYKQGHPWWFGVSFGLTVVSMVVLSIWSIMVSTSRLLSEEEDSVEVDNPDVIFRNNRLNFLLSLLCLGPPLHSFQMFLVCASRFKELWKSSTGVLIEKERLYYLYVHTLNLKMAEGLLEAAPQLIVQVYVMLEERKDVSLIQKISAPLCLLSLTWMITSMEAFREFKHYNLKLIHNLIIFLSNLGIIAARALAIVCFTIAFRSWILLLLGVHCFIINFTGFVLWRSKRKQDMLVFIFAYSPLYLFVYSSYYLKKLRGDAPFGQARLVVVTVSWYVLFTLENIGMILGYYFSPHDTSTPQWFPIFAVVVVTVGNLGGIVLKSLSWYCCFQKDEDEYLNVQRANTLLVTTGHTMNRV